MQEAHKKQTVSKAGENPGRSGIPARHGKQSLSRSFLWMAAGQVALIVSQWTVLALLARLADASAVGQFALGLAVVAPVVMFFRLKLRSVLASDAGRTYGFRDYLTLSAITSGLTIVAVAAIVLIAGYSRDTLVVVLLVALARSTESLSETCYGLFQSVERLDWLARSLAARAIGAGALALTMLLLSSPTAITAAAALLLPWTMVFLLHDLPLARRCQRKRDGDRTPVENEDLWPARLRVLGRLARLAAPLGVVTMATSLVATMPRFFVESFLGEASLGIFAALAYASVPGTTLANSMGQTVISRMAKSLAEGRALSFLKLLGWSTGLAAGLALAGVAVARAWGAWILGLLYGPEYAGHAGLLVWIMLAAGVACVSTIVIHAITAARGFRIQVPIGAVTLLVQLGACYWWIPTQGLTGAAKALLLARCCQLVGSCVALAVMLLRSEQRRKAEPRIPCQANPIRQRVEA